MNTDYCSDQLSILLAAYQVANKNEDKHYLGGEIEQWISSLNPKYSHEQISNFLQSQKGTPLEKFLLRNEDFDMCSKIIRIAFSRNSRTTRVAIGSYDKLCNGFLLVTNNLKGFFSETYQYGKSVNLGFNTWSYFPKMVSHNSDSSTDDVFKGKAILRCEDEGFEVRVSWPTQFPNSASLATSYQRNSHVGEDAISLSEAGLRIELSDNQLRLVSGSPESMIKLMGMLSRNEILTLDSGYDTLKARIALSATDENSETILKTLFIAKKNPAGWLGIRVMHSMDWISEKLKLTASRVLFPHELWTTIVWDNI